MPDGDGNVTSVVDPLNHETQKGYDGLNRLIQITDPNNGVSQLAYNALDQQTSVTDPRTLTTVYTVDAFGDVTTTQSPDSEATIESYDAAGNVLTCKDAKNQTTHYQYDALNRLVQITYADSSVTTFTYDQGTNGIGHLTGMSDASGSTAWTYDAQGRVSSKAATIAGETLTTQNGYDGSGQLITMTLPSSHVIGYTWVNGQITSVTLDSHPLMSSLTYQPFGGLTGWTFANGETVSRSYDQDGRMSSNALDTIGYDAASNVQTLALGNLNILTGSKAYGYDELDRLTSYASSGVPISYSYDANGNRTQQSGDGTAATLVINSGSNRISSITAGTNSATFSYDANGSILADVANAYTYNAAGRLATANTGTYNYNGMGERTIKTVGLVTTLFDYDASGHLIGEYNANGSPFEETIWLGDMPIATVNSTGTYYIHTDHLNTPRQIDDSNGHAVWAWDTITFGSAQPLQDPNNTGTQFVYNLRMPGQYYDAESGLFQNRYRDFNPSVGRYLESDPIGLSGGVNTYAYVGGNPLTFIDPLGLNGEGARDWAREHIGQDGYGWFDRSPESRGRLQSMLHGRGTFKCNKFAWDALSASGDPPGRTPDGRIPGAKEWGNPNYDIPGYPVLPYGTPLQPGDVLSDGHHVGIYDPTPGPVVVPAVTSAAPPQLLGGPSEAGWGGAVLNNDWGCAPGRRLSSDAANVTGRNVAMTSKVVFCVALLLAAIVLGTDVAYVFKASDQFNSENLHVHVVAWVGGLMVLLQSAWCMLVIGPQSLSAAAKLLISFGLQAGLVAWIAVTSLAYWKGFSVPWLTYVIPAMGVGLLMFWSHRVAKRSASPSSTVT